MTPSDSMTALALTGEVLAISSCSLSRIPSLAPGISWARPPSRVFITPPSAVIHPSEPITSVSSVAVCPYGLFSPASFLLRLLRCTTHVPLLPLLPAHTLSLSPPPPPLYLFSSLSVSLCLSLSLSVSLSLSLSLALPPPLPPTLPPPLALQSRPPSAGPPPLHLHPTTSCALHPRTVPPRFPAQVFPCLRPAPFPSNFSHRNPAGA